MSLINETILKEKDRIVYMLEKYNERLLCLPKGSLSEKNEGSKRYYYLKYRKGKKVVSEYIQHKNVEKTKNEIEERKHIEMMIKTLKEELKIVNKALGVKKWFYITEAIRR